MGNLLTLDPKIHRLRTHAKILGRFSHSQWIFFRKDGGIFLRMSEPNCLGGMKRRTHCEARGMLSLGRCILVHTELGRTGFHLSYAGFARGASSVFSWLWLFGCWPSQDLNSPSLLKRSLRASVTT